MYVYTKISMTEYYQLRNREAHGLLLHCRQWGKMSMVNPVTGICSLH